MGATRCSFHSAVDGVRCGLAGAHRGDEADAAGGHQAEQRRRRLVVEAGGRRRRRGGAAGCRRQLEPPAHGVDDERRVQGAASSVAAARAHRRGSSGWRRWRRGVRRGRRPPRRAPPPAGQRALADARRTRQHGAVAGVDGVAEPRRAPAHGRPAAGRPTAAAAVQPSRPVVAGPSPVDQTPARRRAAATWCARPRTDNTVMPPPNHQRPVESWRSREQLVEIVRITRPGSTPELHHRPSRQSDREATRYQVSIGPLPLTRIVPRGRQTNSSFNSSYVARVIWISPGVPWDSIRLAVFTASPHRS